MAIWQRGFGLGAISAIAVTGCVSDGPDADTVGEIEAATEISVTVPPERLTPFCQAMIDLTDRVRSAESDVSEDEIVETYRSIRDDVPREIATDFGAVLAALESGAPPPTDPPPETIVTVPPTSSTVAGSTDEPDAPAPTTDAPADTSTDAGSDTTASSETTDTIETTETTVAPDLGFADGTTPGERLNNYVTFACRDTQNNPGPPATQPLGDIDTSDTSDA